MSRVTDAKETANQAIRFIKSFPCFPCSYYNVGRDECRAGVKYKGTCPVYSYLRAEFSKLREKE